MIVPPVRQAPGQAEAAAAVARLQRLSAARAQDRALTDGELEELDTLRSCMHCGGVHVRACPRVRRIAFFQNGLISEVEFWPHDQVDWSGVVFEDQGSNAGLDQG